MYVYNMHVFVWVFETLVVIWLAVFYTKWPLDVCSLGHRDAIARDSVTCTLCCMIEPALDPD